MNEQHWPLSGTDDEFDDIYQEIYMDTDGIAIAQPKPL
jgi:hypothetical protein